MPKQLPDHRTINSGVANDSVHLVIRKIQDVEDFKGLRELCLPTDEKGLARGQQDARIWLALYQCVNLVDKVVEAVGRDFIVPIKDVQTGRWCALDVRCPERFIRRVLADQRRKISGICCQRKEYRDEPLLGGKLDGLSGDDGLSGTRLAEHNGVAVVEDVVELSFPVIAGTGAEFERRPPVPLFRGSEAARKAEGQRPSLLDITDIPIEIVASHR